MRLVILGAGALGSIIGAHLVQAGEEVTIIARGQRATFLEQHGLRITGLADIVVPVTVSVAPQEVHEADALVVAVKTYDTDTALQSVRHLAVESVLSVQNGVLKNEQLARVFGWEKVVGAAASLSGEVMADATVRFTNHERLFVGELSGQPSERMQTLATTLHHAGIHTEVSPHIQSEEWSKYIRIVSFMAPAVLTRLTTPQFLADSDTATIVARLIHETAQLAAKLGVPLVDVPPVPNKTLSTMPVEEAVVTICRAGEAMAVKSPHHKISTLQDLERGRRLEVEEILGYAVHKGVELGVSVPTVDTCYRLIAAINRTLQ